MTMDAPKFLYPGGLTDREHAILDAHHWQIAHAAENTPVPSEAYTVIVELLHLLPWSEVSSAIEKYPVYERIKNESHSPEPAPPSETPE